MQFLKLTDANDGRPVLINTTAIALITAPQSGEGTIIYYVGDETRTRVVETRDEIECMLVVTVSTRQQRAYAGVDTGTAQQWRDDEGK